MATFAWPFLLPLLLLIPVALAGYVWAGRRRRRAAVTYSSVALIRAAGPARAGWRRHLPFALLLAALSLLLLAAARPQVRTEVPVASSSVILALDVSGSMCATDVDPNRLAAAQVAVRDFLAGQDSQTRIGIVVFSGFAQLAVQPTTDRAELLNAVDSLTIGRGTTIGSAILKSVDAISQINPDVAPASAGGAGSPGGTGGQGDPGGQGGQGGGTGPGGPGGPGGAAPGAGGYAPEIIVLLTDGANTRGVGPVEAARVAAARGVRVYPIGFGTTNPTMMSCTAEQLGGSGFDPMGPGGGRFGSGREPGRSGFLVADEPTLREVAATTGGTYFGASDAGQLQEVLADLPRHVQLQQRDVEVSAGLAGVAALLVLLAVGAAVRWSAFPA